MSRANAPCPVEALDVIVLTLFPHPPIPQEPAYRRRNGTPADDGHGAQPPLVDAYKADDKYADRADMLYNDGRVCDEGPEVVRFKSGVALEVFKEGPLIGVIVRICAVDSISSAAP